MAKPLSLAEIRKRSVAFVRDWREEPGAEKQQAHQFVADLLKVYGLSESKAALYEKRARRSSTGRGGYIDALVPGLCAIEMKSKGADLEAAEQQALDYLDDLSEAEMPRWVITSDFATIRLLELSPDGADATTYTLEQLPERCDALAFLAGYQQRTFGSREQEQASVKAAKLMGSLYESLEASGYDDHEASVFLVRTLFALYADDAGVWERDLFYEFVETRTAEDGSDLGAQLSVLFQALNRESAKRQRTLDPLVQRFPYVNGDLFGESVSIPSFDSEMRDKLLGACAFNWSKISPAVFGSLFQSVKDKAARRELGEHYTTRTNILKTINPLFMDELRERAVEAHHDVKKLKKLRDDLAKVRVFDPACGCGNFLVVAYAEMRALDLQILERLQQLGDSSETLFFVTANLKVTLDHFVGLELEEWPARIAATALHLVDHQANLAMELSLGAAPEPLPLNKVNSIHVADALETDWRTVLVPSDDVRIVGNPPFLGHATRSPTQAQQLREVWGRQDIGRLDYVTAWFKKAVDYFAGIEGGRFALVSTNSIVQGEPVPALFGPIFQAGWRLRFAHRTFAWSSEAANAAAVHCVITGFDKDNRPPARLFSYPNIKGEPTEAPAKSINAYLVDAPNVLIEQRRQPLSPELPACTFGNMARDGGGLIVEAAEHDAFAADPVAAKYLRPFVGARELLHDLPRWCLWMVDLDPNDVTTSPLLKERLEFVRATRAQSRAASTAAMAATPHLFGQRSQPSVPYLGIPRHVSETRPYFSVKRLPPSVICGDANFTAPDPDGFLFGVISSSMFMTWLRTVGGKLKSDLRFSNTIVWNTLPLPAPSAKTRAAVIEAGQDVLAARALHPQRSLADHYNPLAMDPALLKAHAGLDRVVDKAFGSRKALHAEQERQAVLFSRYADLTA